MWVRIPADPMRDIACHKRILGVRMPSPARQALGHAAANWQPISGLFTAEPRHHARHEVAPPIRVLLPDRCDGAGDLPPFLVPPLELGRGGERRRLDGRRSGVSASAQRNRGRQPRTRTKVAPTAEIRRMPMSRCELVCSMQVLEPHSVSERGTLQACCPRCT